MFRQNLPCEPTKQPSGQGARRARARACDELVGSSVKFHWSSPLLPAFCLFSGRVDECIAQSGVRPVLDTDKPVSGQERTHTDNHTHSHHRSSQAGRQEASKPGAIKPGRAHHRVDGEIRVHQRVVEPPARAHEGSALPKTPLTRLIRPPAGNPGTLGHACSLLPPQVRQNHMHPEPHA